MNAQLIQTEDEHHLVLLDHRVTQLVVEARALRVHSWSLDGSLEVRLGIPFVWRAPSGATRTLDPEQTEQLAPALGWVRRVVRSVTVTRAGELTLEFGDRSSLIAPPHPREGAWEVTGGGLLEGVHYRCDTAAGAPWE